MFVKCADLDVHVQFDGPTGAPVLMLLHSLGTTLHVWDAQVAALSRAFRIVRFDMRGHGLTTVTPGPYTIEQLARDALEVMQTLKIGMAHVAGLSIGGMIAQSLASLAPDHVASLVLLDTAMAIAPAELWRERAATVRAQGMAAVADAVLARWVTPGYSDAPPAHGLRAMLLRTDPEGYAGSAEAIASADLTQATTALRVPALVMVGDRDQATPVGIAEALHAAIEGSSLEIIHAGAHIPNDECAPAVNDAIARFLATPAVDPHDAGMTVRRQVLGSDYVDAAVAATTPFDTSFQEFITRTAWGGVWARPGLDRRTRSLLTLTMLAALGHHDEFRLHVRATRNTGVTADEVAEAMIQVAAYAGIPAANAAMRVAKDVLRAIER